VIEMRWLRAFVAGVAAFCATSADAVRVLDHGKIEFGIGNTRAAGNLAVNGRGGFDGSVIDLDRDLDVGERDDNRTVAISWRAFDRHEFGFRTQRIERDGDRVIERDISFDGEVFPINSRIKGKFGLDLWSLDYTAWLIASDQRAIGLRLGALQYRLGLSIKAENLPGGSQPEVLQARTRADLPVLVLGGEYREAITERLRFVLHAVVFEASIDRIDVRVYDLSAGLEMALTKHAALSLRYFDTRLVAQSERYGFNGRLRLDLTGVQSSLIWRW